LLTAESSGSRNSPSELQSKEHGCYSPKVMAYLKVGRIKGGRIAESIGDVEKKKGRGEAFKKIDQSWVPKTPKEKPGNSSVRAAQK